MRTWEFVVLVLIATAVHNLIVWWLADFDHEKGGGT
jgi:hypothetical protein